MQKMIMSTSIETFPFNSSNKSSPHLKERVETPAIGGSAVSSSRIRLGIERGIFSREGTCFPVLTALAANPVLQAMSNGEGTVVLGDAAGVPVAAVERTSETAFQIFSTQGQSPVARVTRNGDALNAIMEGESDPTYTVHKIEPHPSRNFRTKHIVKQRGKAVASTRYGNGNSYVITVNAGTDSCLITCLAAIADEILC